MLTASQLYGLALIAGYAVLIGTVVWTFAGGRVFSKLGFLVADREVSLLPAAISIAAAWIWAPALFVSAQKAYTQGWVGLFWFLLPNVSCLVLFAFFAERIRNQFPDGFTLSHFMRSRFSKRVQTLYVIELGGLAICSFAVQLVAGGQVIATMTTLPYPVVIVLLALIPIGYTFMTGLRGSVASDFFQMALIGLVGVITIPWAVSNSGGMHTVLLGLFGKSGTYYHLWSGDGLTVFLTFGIPVTIGLLSGPFGDQSFWQRAFAVKRDSVRNAFLLGAVFFVIVPLGMSFLGFSAAGAQIPVKDASRVNMAAVNAFLPSWVAVPFLYLLLSGLVSKLDTNLSAISSIAGHDFLNEQHNHPLSRVRLFARGSMVVLTLGGLSIAYIIGTYVANPVLYLFLVYGTLRSSVLLPTVISLMKKDVSEAGIFWGIIVSLSIGLPVFAYANLQQIVPLIIGGSLFTVLASGVTTLVMSRTR